MSHYGIAIAKGHRDLVRLVNGVLESMHADGSWDALARDLEHTLPELPRAVQPVPQYRDAAVICAEASCGGAVEDGYCAQCGLAARSRATGAGCGCGARRPDLEAVDDLPCDDHRDATPPPRARARRGAARAGGRPVHRRDGRPDRARSDAATAAVATDRSGAAATASRAAPRATAAPAARGTRSTRSSPRRDRRRSVRRGRVPGPRRARLDLPRTRSQGVRSLGGPQGPARREQRRRRRRGTGRAAVPRRGRAPEHRQDPQLRRARQRRLHRDGARQRRQPAGHPRGPSGGQRRPHRPTADRAGDRLLPGDPPGARAPARPRPGLLRLQAGQRDPDGRVGEAHRPRRRVPHGRRGQPDLRHRRLPGAGDRRDRADGGVGPVHRRAHAGGAEHGLPDVPVDAPLRPARRRPRSPCTPASSRSTPSWSGRLRPSLPTASPRPRRWPRSSPACCARSSRPTRACRRRDRARASPRRAGLPLAPTGRRCRPRWSTPRTRRRR